ncbi:MAG: type II toxin-antitoxin system RelE/ParE family toxin [Propylenella sp.]
MPRIIWSLLAEYDRDLHADYLAVHSPRAAATLGEAIVRAVEGLLGFPDIGRPGRVPGTRELIVVRTPYLVICERAGETIHILRVLHGAQQWPPPD